VKSEDGDLVSRSQSKSSRDPSFRPARPDNLRPAHGPRAWQGIRDGSAG